jgi:hypothetical protein
METRRIFIEAETNFKSNIWTISIVKKLKTCYEQIKNVALKTVRFSTISISNIHTKCMDQQVS